MKREFTVETPLGRLKVWAKQEQDSPADFPGVYIDLVHAGEDNDMLACVEYDSTNDRLQTCVYQPGIDEPTAVITHSAD